MLRKTRTISTLAAAIMLLPVLVRADPLDDYTRLRQWKFSSTPEAVPAEGVSWSRDTATWSLASGQIWVQEATADGTVTGLVFEGEGNFSMEIPDRFELEQLKRFRREDDLQRLDYRFTKLVLRGSNLDALPLPLEAPAEVAAQSLAEDRHSIWLEHYFVDADARVVAALQNPDAEYLRASMLTDEDDWVVYDYDSHRLEEIWLRTEVKGRVESWVSLDRPQHRREDGRPSGGEDPPLDLEHLDVSARIGGLARRACGGGRSSVSCRDTDFSATLDFQVRQAGAQSIRLTLHRYARVDRVTDGNGVELPFVRDNIGERSRSLDKELHDPQLTVFTADPLTTGERLTLTVDYELAMSNYVSGNSWYPTFRPPDSGLVDRHTARIEVTAPNDLEIRAMGVRQTEAEEGKTATTVFRVDRPAKMVTFTTLKRSIEERLEVADLPPVVVSSSERGMSEDMLHDTGADLVHSMGYFQTLFGSKLQAPELRAVMIAAGHGQAFDGMLHLSEYSGVESSTMVPFFRAHEVAHQWWGHQVGWKTYRDQWLSEGFAEYSAMLYLAASLDNGEKLFLEALQVSSDELTGSLKTMFSRFARPGQTLLNKRAVDRLGPVGHGFRANVAESPGAYSSVAYSKGAYILHMLRTVLRGASGSDEAFFAILRDFAETYQGKAASTEDFQQIVARHAPADWAWFFNQWVYEASIPTYKWDWKAKGKTPDGKVEVVLHVRQQDVSPGFRMLVPVRIHLPGGRGGEVPIMIDEPEKEITIALPARPRKVEFNPNHAVLARVKRR